MWPPTHSGADDVRDALAACSGAADAPTVVFVSKMFTANEGAVVNGAQPPTLGGRGERGASGGDGSRGVLLGFARVLSGVLRAGQKLHLCTAASAAAVATLGESVAALRAPDAVTVAESIAVYPHVMMGGEYHGVPTASAGMIVALGGLSGRVARGVTLSSDVRCPSLATLKYQVSASQGRGERWPPLHAQRSHHPSLPAPPSLAPSLAPALLRCATRASARRSCESRWRRRTRRSCRSCSAACASSRKRTPPSASHWRTGTNYSFVCCTIYFVCSHTLCSTSRTAASSSSSLSGSFTSSTACAAFAKISPRLRSGALRTAPPRLSVFLRSARAPPLRCPRLSARSLPHLRARPPVYALVLVSDRSASPPIISFRETITARGDAVEAATADRHVTLRVRAEPLGAALTEMVAVAVAGAIAAAAEAGDASARGSGGGGATASFVEALRALPSSDDARAALPADEVWALAPSHAGPCVLRASTEVRSVAAALLVANGLLAGFNAAASAGPMCGEPMHGVAIVVEEIVVAEGAASGAGAGGAGGAESVEARAASSSQHGQSQHGPLSGQIISTSQRACRSAFLAKNSSPRLVEPYYRCKLQCSGEQLGALYGVLARRRGVVIEEDLWEGTPIFSIVSLLPVSRRRALAPGALRLQWLFAISRRLLARALSLVRPLSLSLSLSLSALLSSSAFALHHVGRRELRFRERAAKKDIGKRSQPAARA